MAELVSVYADLPLGSVDASVVAAAERLGATTLFSLDRRHFTVVTPQPHSRVHPPALTLVGGDHAPFTISGRSLAQRY